MERNHKSFAYQTTPENQIYDKVKVPEPIELISSVKYIIY